MSLVKTSLFWLALLYVGSVSIGEELIPEAKKFPLTATTEMRIVASLYSFARNLENFDEVTLQNEHRRLVRNTPPGHYACQEPQYTLRLVMLLSGIAPNLRDFPRARQLLRTCAARSFGLLLNGYIHAQITSVDNAEHNWNELRMLRQQLEAGREQEQIMGARIKALEAKLQELSVENKQLSVENKQLSVENKQLSVENEELTTKIEALTTIEQNLQEQERIEVEQDELQQELTNE